jgi:hypothetical protein
MRGRWLLLSGLAIGPTAPLRAQGLRIDPAAAAARGALRPADFPTPTIPRFAAAGLGFLAGAAAGLGVAYFVDQSRSSGEGRLENYIAIPLALGAVTFMTVFVAMGD